ncbi:RidA family protein [Adhaeribacter sp. BT258]|uniref:RidA family protein n=1 Tax=Adhaeribacter terrigena TaxID=2793070 RepID=A0ABS1BXA0_9BACT|nr:RidA family protein [Adhaeribacter terrigena]MBK0401497.1 RidA family protein [Adhaeribacter terrigena]
MKKLPALMLILVLMLNGKANAQGILEQNGKVFHLHPSEKDWNYAQAYRSGNLLYISGTVGNDDMDKAMERVYKTLEVTLKKYNLDFTHVVKENLFAKDIEAVKKHKDIRRKYYGTHTPAATWVEITRLLDNESVLEVELIAEIKKTE